MGLEDGVGVNKLSMLFRLDFCMPASKMVGNRLIYGLLEKVILARLTIVIVFSLLGAGVRNYGLNIVLVLLSVGFSMLRAGDIIVFFLSVSGLTTLFLYQIGNSESYSTFSFSIFLRAV